jgi:hypothetical protein
MVVFAIRPKAQRQRNVGSKNDKKGRKPFAEFLAQEDSMMALKYFRVAGAYSHEIQARNVFC